MNPFRQRVDRFSIADHKTVSVANKDYHDAIAGVYERDVTTIALFGRRSACVRRAESVLKTIASDGSRTSFLDVGCGTGFLSSIAAGIFDKNIGTDISRGMLSQAAEKGHSVVRADVLRLPFRDGRFDAAGAFSVLHHIYEIVPVLKEVRRVLRDGGSFYSDWDPNAAFAKAHPVGRMLRIFAKSSSFAFYPVFALWSLMTGRNPGALAKKQWKNFLLAEYHANLYSGFEPEVLRNSFLEAGFREVDVFQHDNEPFLPEIAGLNGARGVKDNSKGKYLAVIARK